MILVAPATASFDVAKLPAHSLVIHPEHDEVVPLAATLDWARPQALPVVVVPGGSHFFHGQLPLLKSLVLRHLADTDVVWGWRMRLILAQDRPPITGFDQDLWAERLDYANADPSESLETFAVLRRDNLRLIERATPDDLKRVGVHAERGEESAGYLVRLYAGHDLMHLAQITRIARAVA